jgi:hypothetical protein
MMNENMFCPKCGNADQKPETYCRQCGTFLPDFEKNTKKSITPEEHLKANSVLSLMTAVASLTLAILLYSFFLNKENVPVIIYVTAGFLVAMCAWQIQTFWRTLLLKKHFKQPKNNLTEEIKLIEKDSLSGINAQTNKLLEEPDFKNIVVPPGIIEETTKTLDKVRRK